MNQLVILMMMSNKNLLLGLIISKEDLNAAFVVAGIIFATVPIGIYGIVTAMRAQKPSDIIALKLFNWSLVLCGMYFFFRSLVTPAIWLK